MAKLVKLRWQSDHSTGLPRKDRRGGEYHAYVPDLLVGRPVRLDTEVVADVADAEAAVARFDASATALSDTEALARLLLRAESVASSRIEGLEVGGRRLLKAEAAALLGSESQDVTAREVLGNIQAMSHALAEMERGRAITVDQLLRAHDKLLQGSPLAEFGGRLRETQNWIGGSNYHPLSAVFVPPPADEVRPLLQDLCDFCNGDDLPAVVQAALAHAQFETIHPFVDGNGRIGRVLIHLVLRRRGLSVRAVPPVSLILATWSEDYVAGLGATRYVGKPTSPAAATGTNQWVGLFATACRRAVEDAEAFEAQVAELQSRWRQRLSPVRKDSAVDRLVHALPGMPILTASDAAKLIGRTFQATNLAIDRLVQAQILKQLNVGLRNRAFEAPEVFQTFTALERRLASPAGDTRSAAPARRVPYR